MNDSDKKTKKRDTIKQGGEQSCMNDSDKTRTKKADTITEKESRAV